MSEELTRFGKVIECLHSAIATIEIELATIKAQIERLENVEKIEWTESEGEDEE